MLPFLNGQYGNPSSGHWAAVNAHAALNDARARVAALLSCEADEIVFTSGGTEANNLAIKGAFLAATARGDHIITTLMLTAGSFAYAQQQGGTSDMPGMAAASPQIAARVSAE